MFFVFVFGFVFRIFSFITKNVPSAIAPFNPPERSSPSVRLPAMLKLKVVPSANTPHNSQACSDIPNDDVNVQGDVERKDAPAAHTDSCDTEVPRDSRDPIEDDTESRLRSERRRQSMAQYGDLRY